jgi:hypothetical protein
VTDDAKGLFVEGEGLCDMLPLLEHGPDRIPAPPSLVGRDLF